MIFLEPNLNVMHGWISHQFSGVSSGSVLGIEFRRLKTEKMVAEIVERKDCFMNLLGSTGDISLLFLIQRWRH